MIWAIAILVINRRADDKISLVRKWIILLVTIVVTAGPLVTAFPLISSRFHLGFLSELPLDQLSINSAIAKAPPSNSDVQRLQLVSVGLDLIAQRPWLGWGPDATRLIGIFSPYPRLKDLTQFHNGYVQTLVHFGIVGTAFLTILIVAGVRFALLGRTANPESDRLSKILFATLLALVVYIMIANFAESVLMVKAPAMICLFIAAIACLRPTPSNDEMTAANISHMPAT